MQSMNKLVLYLFILLALLGCGSDREVSEIELCKIPNPITLKGENKEYESLLAKMSEQCSAYDQCALTCMRAQCAENIGGGCSHMCSQINIGAEEKSVVLKRRAKDYYQIEHSGGCQGNDI